MQNVSLQTLKSISCFSAVTFYSTSHLCVESCFLHDNTMSLLYFLSIIAKPLFFLLIGFMDEDDNIGTRAALWKLKSIILIVLFWNILFFFMDSTLFKRGYLLQNDILISLAFIYLLHPLLAKRLCTLRAVIAAVVLILGIAVIINMINAPGAVSFSLALPGYFTAWIFIAYYLIGRLLGSGIGKRVTKAAVLARLSRWAILPAAALLFFCERFLSENALRYFTSWFLLEHLLVLSVSLLLFVLFDNLRIANRGVIAAVRFISPTMVGVYIVHYSVFYLISTAYDFDNVTLRFTLLVLVFLASVIVSRLLLLTRFTSQVISL